MSSSSRAAIMSRIRAVLPQSVPRPDLPAVGPWQTFDDPRARFAEVLKFVGGEAVFVQTLAEAGTHLQSLTEWQAARVRCSVVEGVGESTLDLAHIDDPHALENVDFAVLRAHLAVAENGAVWVTDATVTHRVMYFIPQRLAIVVPAKRLVHNMHEAYAQIAPERHQFAAFISGPSKTADIEQSLVIGAHGARALTVYLVEELE